MDLNLIDRIFDPQRTLLRARKEFLCNVFDFRKATHGELSDDPEARLRQIIADAKAAEYPRSKPYQKRWTPPVDRHETGFWRRLSDPYGWCYSDQERWLSGIFDEMQAPYDGPPFSTQLRLAAIIENARSPQLSLAL